VLEGSRATRSAVATNTNLGTVLLIAPLATVARGTDLADGIQKVLQGLDADDSRLVYEAIRLAEPGGLGKTDQHDIADPAPTDLIAAMRTGADHDLVARQYTNGFSQVLGEVVAWLAEGLGDGWALDTTILHVQMRMMSQYGDSLIARKCGEPVSRQSAERATRVLESGTPQDETYHAAMGDLDFWLRSDGHRRNPGTTADLIAAGLFVALREGIIKRPVRMGIQG
jgi:triphosphoribosyl-dephospho-CoA synthase